MKIFKTRIYQIKSLGENLNMAELGVFEGNFSKELFKECNPNKLYLIDLFEGYFGSGDKDGLDHHFVQLEDEYLKLKEYFKDNSNVIIENKSTIDFLNNIEDNSIDLIYIDADHSYDAVKNDLKLAYNKVKYNGYICGHDYVKGTDVERAVNEFCNEFQLVIDSLSEDGCPTYVIIKKK